MPAGATKTRFGRCPYCRAMICQSTSAAIYYCTKCRTPIRGKNTEPTDDQTDNALSSLEILSAVDTESVFSDDLEGSSTQPSVIDVDGDQPPFSCGYNSNSDANSQGITASSPSPYRSFGSPRAGSRRSNGSLPRHVEDGLIGSDGQGEVRVRPVNSRVDALRASSRRTRRASSASDPSILRRGDFSVSVPEEAPWNASGQQLHRSATTTRELRTSASVSGMEPSRVMASSPLTDPAFQRDLLHALDKLRGMIADIELTASGGKAAVTRRDSRLFRRLESRLAEELPAHDAAARAPRWNDYSSTGSASRSSASSSSGHVDRQAARPRRKRHCFPVLGGAPFVVCGACSELLQAPPTSTTPSRRRGNVNVRLRCGGCEEVLEVALPVAAGIAGHARRKSGASGSGELERAASRSGGGGAQELPLLLHRAMGYDSVSQVLQSRRY